MIFSMWTTTAPGVCRGWGQRYTHAAIQRLQSLQCLLVVGGQNTAYVHSLYRRRLCDPTQGGQGLEVMIRWLFGGGGGGYKRLEIHCGYKPRRLEGQEKSSFRQTGPSRMPSPGLWGSRESGGLRVLWGSLGGGGFQVSPSYLSLHTSHAHRGFA